MTLCCRQIPFNPLSWLVHRWAQASHPPGIAVVSGHYSRQPGPGEGKAIVATLFFFFKAPVVWRHLPRGEYGKRDVRSRRFAGLAVSCALFRWLLPRRLDGERGPSGAGGAGCRRGLAPTGMVPEEAYLIVLGDPNTSGGHPLIRPTSARSKGPHQVAGRNTAPRCSASGRTEQPEGLRRLTAIPSSDRHPGWPFAAGCRGVGCCARISSKQGNRADRVRGAPPDAACRSAQAPNLRAGEAFRQLPEKTALPRWSCPTHRWR